MLPKEKRITGTRDFKRVYQKGSFFSVPAFSLNWLSNRTKTTRLGIVVTKKVESKAVGRNLLKRRFREAARALYGKMPQGLDVVITIKGGAKGKKFTDIIKDLELALLRLGNKNEKNRN